MLSVLHIASVFAACSFALPAPSGHSFIAPGLGDVRSPCPGLNSLANHGFLHRSGRNMTIDHLIQGGKAGMNIGADFMLVIGGAGILSNPNPSLGYFDLDHLAEHNFPIEHDGSLSRQDEFFGNWYDFNSRSYSQWMSNFGDAQETSIKSASKARFARINDSLVRNPEAVYGPREFVLSYGETGLYLQTMSQSITSGVAPLSYVRSLFEEERLPYELGWSPPAEPVTLVSLAAMAVKLNLANAQESLPEGLTVLSEGVLRDAFAGIDPITGKLANITDSLLGGLGIRPA